MRSMRLMMRSARFLLPPIDRKSTRLNSSHVEISYAVFCLKKKNGEEEVTRQLPGEICALAEVAEVVLGKRSHEGVLVVLQPRVRVIIGEVHACVSVHHIDDHSDAVLVAQIHKCLEIRTLTEAFIDAEVADRQIAPIDRNSDVRQRHDLDIFFNNTATTEIYTLSLHDALPI